MSEFGHSSDKARSTPSSTGTTEPDVQMAGPEIASQLAQSAEVAEVEAPKEAEHLMPGPKIDPALAGPAPGPEAAGLEEAPGAEAAAAEPKTLDRTAVNRYLRPGSDGDQVKALQGFVGAEDDGDYGSGTAEKVKEWQKKNKLPATGRADRRTVAAMRGDEHIYGYSWNHDPEKFVPKYPMTAYHESGIYRSESDPYATGAITNPTKKQDSGGKTYGTYQFESYHYRDGTKDKTKAKNSTLQRFMKNKDNPYGKDLSAVAKEHGVTSKEFDAAWKKLAADDNKAFGAAQEDFLEADVAKRLKELMDKAGVSEADQKNMKLKDLMVGTANQYGSLADGHARAAGAAQKAAGRKLSIDEIAKAVQDHKANAVKINFKSSPKAWPGLLSRINAEGAAFGRSAK